MEVKDIREKSTKAGLGSTDVSFNHGIDWGKTAMLCTRKYLEVVKL